MVVRVSGMSMGTTFITHTGRSTSDAANLKGKREKNMHLKGKEAILSFCENMQII